MGCTPPRSQRIEYNYEVPNTKAPGFSGIYRKMGITEMTTHPSNGVTTMKELIENSYKTYPNKRGLGQITATKVTNSQGQEETNRTMRDFTYAQLYEMSMGLGKSLYHRKLWFEEDEMKMHLVGVYAKNRYEWFLYDWACIHFGFTTVPLYDTLGIENLTYCLNQTGLTTLFVQQDLLKNIVGLKDRGNLRTIVLLDEPTSEIKQQCQSANLELLYIHDLINEGKELTSVNNAHVKTSPKDCYTFCYTSGTTGPPKGAMLSHGNFLAFLANANTHVDIQFQVHDDIYMSYLPLPHVMERAVVYGFYLYGKTVVVYSGDKLALKDDCKFAHPTVLISVPKIYNRIVDAVKGQFAQKGCLSKTIIEKGLRSKLETAHEDGVCKHSFYDMAVFSKVQESFGSNIRVLITGSAPINPEIQAFMSIAMSCPLIEGYGQTECAGGCLSSRAGDINYGSLSQLSSSVEVKLCDIPEMKYTADDRNDKNQPTPRGQLWVRGPQIFMGYYKQSDKTKEAITVDGWLRTGDVVQILPDTKGFKIVDRRKNIFKLQQGEYVAPEKVEGVYIESPMVSEVFLHGESLHSFAVAVIVPHEPEFMKWAESKGFKGAYKDLCQQKEVRQQLLTVINKEARSKGIFGFELAKNAYLETESFMAKGVLTNTLKMIRFETRQEFKAQIDAMYQEGQIAK